jgi:site-specific recombinase XerD
MTKSTGQRRWHIKNVRPRHPGVTPIGRWSSANRNCYADFRGWLQAAGYGDSSLQQYCVGARLVFGLIDKPYWVLEPESDLPRVRDFIAEHIPSRRTQEAYRMGMVKLCEFLASRTHRPAGPRALNWTHYLEGTPAWLGEAVKAYLIQSRRAWRPEEVHRKSVEFLSDHTRSLRWMATHATWHHLSDVTPAVWFAYVDERLAVGIQPVTLNRELFGLQGFVRFCAEEGQPICPRMLEVKPLKAERRLPRDVSVDHLQTLWREISQAATSRRANVCRMGLMDRAWFLLMLHSGLRTIEVRRLTLDQLDLERRQVRIEQSKGLKDRLVYLSGATVQALEAYLPVRGPAGTEREYVFLYRHQPLSRRYVGERLRTYGRRCGVKATPHQLRHSCATLLLNAGAPVLTVQTILGHQHVDTTLGYARLYDGTVAADYYRAMAQVESRLATNDAKPMVPPSAGELLALVDALRNGTLTEGQVQTVQALRAGILALNQ